VSSIAMPEPDPRVLSRAPQIIAALRAVLPADAVISDPEETRAYECDALTAYRCPPLAVVLPRTTGEVAAAMRVCHDMRVPVVPRGAGTSLAGGALPTADCVVIGTMRLREVLEIDTANRFIRVQTGVTNLSVSAELEPLGFFYAPDPSSQLACTIAGNIAMNSGGAHCLKYGVTTNNLMGATMVLTTGEVVELGGPEMGPDGLDLMGLICGSEGQLGIVTEATLRILPRPEGARPVLIGFRRCRGRGRMRGAHHPLGRAAGRHRIYGRALPARGRGLCPRRLSQMRRRAGGRGRGLARGNRLSAGQGARDRRCPEPGRIPRKPQCR
jgi:glycolate oxidase